MKTFRGLIEIVLNTGYIKIKIITRERKNLSIKIIKKDFILN
ncbi:hypothetical protein PFUGPA_01252 [Plasmodium falciparum Palo Alto/Uganda]|nr:hypothetical protein PFUGPA_01252 [Plasmodium falciparum Palo Alto/Uganda]